MAEKRRLLQPHYFQVAHDCLWVADWFLPVVARVPTGRCVDAAEIVDWSVDPARRHLPGIGALAVSDDGDLWIASPWAGQVVHVIPEVSGPPQVVAVPFAGRFVALAVLGHTCWACRMVEADGTQRGQLWRIEEADGQPEPVDMSGDPCSIAVHDGALYAAVRRTNGSAGNSYALVRVRQEGRVEDLLRLSDQPVELASSDRFLWAVPVLGLRGELWRIDLDARRIHQTVFEHPLPGGLVSVGPRRAWFQSAVFGHSDWWDARFALTSVPLPTAPHPQGNVVVLRAADRLELEGVPVTREKTEDELWVLRRHGSSGPTADSDVMVLGAEPAQVARAVQLPHIDISPLRPDPVPPPGSNPDQVAADWRQHYEGLRLRPWLKTLATNVSGSFPDTELIITFVAADRPNVIFGVRERIFTEAGLLNPEIPLLSVHLDEDLNVPPPERSVPDERGIVWIDGAVY